MVANSRRSTVQRSPSPMAKPLLAGSILNLGGSAGSDPNNQGIAAAIALAAVIYRYLFIVRMDPVSWRMGYQNCR
jgi:hypothetical protein